ncbi:uncharacterized protein LOC130655650 [Hydractinia symbiolongicarpus]|uniref:uncharacterized protein LOC130655650 n=1 Tax=Hydractinia symbiolongicarpus TaxID=13093 RepID=UPI00254BDE26|nr:uncharacterized protein LOC130655650 [Hydractinia symbiolongicarpus]XP_057314412.1 uncharacterized protein LOC130655650 [Hydractinia symbiolongicarpus]XP_057314413.1 uncharacterized protein LOC130655650 [Hydractinia symbiolongicarpus]
MPLGIGKYSQHNKLSTNGADDDDDVINPVRDYLLLYLGDQKISALHSRNFSFIVDKIYNEKYSPLGALVHLRKFKFIVNSEGITIVQPATRKFPSKIITKYHLSNVLLVTCDLKHAKIFTVVLRGTSNTEALHVYLCSKEEHAKNLIEECIREFQNAPSVKGIKTFSHPDGFEIIRDCDTQTNTSFSVTTDVVEKPGTEIAESKVKKDDNKVNTSTDFGDFQVNLGEVPQSPILLFENIPQQSDAKLKNTSFEDEFEKLALKRNIYQPDHLQDKSVESVLLMQEHALDLNNTREHIFSHFN